MLGVPLLLACSRKKTSERPQLNQSGASERDILETAIQQRGQTVEDVEVATLRRCKKGKMEIVCFSNQENKAIVDIFKELAHQAAPHVQRHSAEWHAVGASSTKRGPLRAEEVNKWVQPKRTMYGKLTLAKSDMLLLDNGNLYPP